MSSDGSANDSFLICFLHMKALTLCPASPSYDDAVRFGAIEAQETHAGGRENENCLDEKAVWVIYLPKCYLPSNVIP